MTKRPSEVVIVDDDPELRGLLQRYLSENGHHVRAVAHAKALEPLLTRDPIDVLILDLMLPDEDGLAICRRLRAQNNQVPILILTAKGDPIDRIIGLEMGADDYLAKPFTPRELLARIQAILRRTGSARTNIDNVVTFGPFILNLADHTLTRNGIAQSISSREYALLQALASHPGRTLSRAQLIDLALGRDAEVTDRAIDVLVTRLRKIIEDDPASPQYVRTNWGAGYFFSPKG